jgi:VWFA-related protein
MATTRVGVALAAALAAIALGADRPRARQSTAADRQDAPAAPRSTRGTEAPQDTPTFRVGTRLATVDAVVVDDQGRHVTDLSPADFEVTERGKRQAVRQVLYVQSARTPGVVRDLGAAPPAGSAEPATPAPAPAAAPAKPRVLGPVHGLPSKDHAGRVIAIVVDDLGLSFDSTAYVRRMLFRYVEQQIAPGDLVAILRTSGGVGALQQFTTDKRLLHAAVDRVRYSLNSRSGVGAFAPVTPPGPSLFGEGAPAGGTSAQNGNWSPLKESPDELRTELTSVGSMGALEYVVRGIEPLEGRKSVVFVSEGFDLGIRERKTSRAWTAFTRVMDRANRAGVVVYAIDPRGLQTAGLTAEDDAQTAKVTPGRGGGPTQEQIRDAVIKPLADRGRALIDSQQSLIYLAEQTGGFAMTNTNDLSRALGKVIADAQGYYLIGFDTSLPSNLPWDPDDVRIRVTRPGLKVRARRGLFGPGDKNLPRETGPTDPLVAAALSPFASGDIDVRLTTLFAHDARAGSYVRSLFFIDPAGLTFVDGTDGKREADLTILLMAIGDNGLPLSQIRVEVPLRLQADAYALLRQRGLLYSASVPIQKPGGYQIRAAVRDDRSSEVGSTAQFVEVPKVGKNQVALSGVVLMDANAAPTAEDGAPAAIAADALADGVLGEPAIKIFKPGTEVVYTCEIYDGRGRRDEGFTTSATLLRDGKPIYTTPPASVSGAPKEAKPVGAVPVGGRLSLGRKLPPGAYTLQVSVGQQGRRERQASQWVDFEVR